MRAVNAQWCAVETPDTEEEDALFTTIVLESDDSG